MLNILRHKFLELKRWVKVCQSPAFICSRYVIFKGFYDFGESMGINICLKSYCIFDSNLSASIQSCQGRIQGEGAGGTHPLPPPPWDEAVFFVFAFKICLPHGSVTSFLRGAPPPKKNPGFAPGCYWRSSSCFIPLEALQASFPDKKKMKKNVQLQILRHANTLTI